MTFTVKDVFRLPIRSVCIAMLTLVAALLSFANYQPVYAQSDCPIHTGGPWGSDDPFLVLRYMECYGAQGASIAWAGLRIEESVPWAPQDELEVKALFVEVADATVSNPPMITFYPDANSAKSMMNLVACASMPCVNSSVQGNRQYVVVTVSKQEKDDHFPRTWEHLIFGHDLSGWRFWGWINNHTQLGGSPNVRIIAGGDTIWLALDGLSSSSGSTWNFDRWFDLRLETVEQEQIRFYQSTTANFLVGANLVNVQSVARPRFSQSTMGAPQLTLIYEITYDLLQGEQAFEVAALQREAVYIWDEASGKFVFAPQASTVTEELLSRKFTFFEADIDFLRFAGDELRTPIFIGPPEQQAARRTLVEGMVNSPEKQALLTELPPGFPAPEQPASASATTCANGRPTQLTVGVRAIVAPGKPNTLYKSAGGQPLTDSQQKKVELPAGSALSIIGGPECVGPLRYWQITFGPHTGWTADGDGKTRWLELAPPPITDCSAAASTKLTIGGRARVAPGDPNTLWSDWRKVAGRTARDTLLAGTTVLILNGPECRDGFMWWEVKSETSGKSGWTAESLVDEVPYLLPEG